jgi:hypothetical protein
MTKAHSDSLARVGLSLTEVRRNIRAVYGQALPHDVMAGLSWYDEAQGVAAEIAQITGKSLDHAAVMIAHLSPRTRWSENIRYAYELASTGNTFGTFRSAVERAQRALDSDDPWSTFGKAPKTRSFAANIRGDMSAVTIDVWAMRIAGVSEQQLTRAGIYEAVAHAYRLEAKRAGVHPAQLQAITWIIIRGAAK